MKLQKVVRRGSKEHNAGHLSLCSDYRFCRRCLSAIDSELEIIYLALEFGTVSSMEELSALRADHWLHAVPNRDTPLIKLYAKSAMRSTLMFRGGRLRCMGDQLILQFGQLRHSAETNKTTPKLQQAVGRAEHLVRVLRMRR